MPHDGKRKKAVVQQPTITPQTAAFEKPPFFFISIE